jgi:hypothetical protein
MSKFSVDALVLNRNLISVTDELIQTLQNFNVFRRLGVIDSGSQKEQISKYTVVRSGTLDAENFGLRINRGFNLGIRWWLNQEETSDFLLLLPNDTEVKRFDWENLCAVLPQRLEIGAIIPLAQESPYLQIIDASGIGLGWSFNEGPIFLSKKFLRFVDNCGTEVFDSDNFRGFMSFVELAIRIYANNFCMVATSHMSYIENESHLLDHAELIRTEEKLLNEELLVKEGCTWLNKKYAIKDVWAFENIARLLFQDYIGSIGDMRRFALK